jgi:hypothetical protein
MKLTSVSFFFVTKMANLIFVRMLALKITTLFIFFITLMFGQVYQRTGKNIGISGGLSKDFTNEQTNIHIGIHSHVAKHFIPEISYRNSTQYQTRRIETFGENQYFITPGIQLRTRFLYTPGRSVRGICTKEFFDIALTPEYNISLNQPIENAFSLRIGLCIYQMKSGMNKSRRAWSYKAEPYYRHGFSNNGIIKSEIGFSLKVTRFEVYNFLK